MFHALLRHSARHGGILGDPAQGVLSWVPLSRARPGGGDIVRSGMWSLPATWSWRALRRLSAHEHETLELLSNRVGADAGYIWVVGVDPAQAGRGLGAALVRKAVAALRLRFARIALKTEQARNVAFYERLGFRVIEETVARATGARVWLFEHAALPGVPPCSPAPGFRA